MAYFLEDFSPLEYTKQFIVEDYCPITAAQTVPDYGQIYPLPV